MRIFVTGATGFLGRAIVRAAMARGHEAVAFARRATAAGLECIAVDGDIRDRGAVAAALQGCDAVCHTAALVSVWRRRRAEFEEVNVGGLRNVIEAAHDHDVRRIVYTSSFLALPPSGADAPGEWNDYQRTKALGNHVAAEYVAKGVPIIRMYPGVIYGPGPITEGNLVGRMIADHLADRLPGLIGADRVWSFAYVDDVAGAHVAALEQAAPGSAYELGGENVPQMKPFEIVRDITGQRLPRRIPVALARSVALVEEALAATTGRPPQLTRGTITILLHDWPVNHDRAERDLGYQVRPLEDGIRHTLASLQMEARR